MSESFIQDDFGGFNPRFPGVTIKFSSPQALIDFEHALSGDIPSGRASLSQVAIRSVLDHEVRHYHDFLISPYSAVIFRMRLQAAINGSKAMLSIKESNGVYLPLPLIRWARMSAEERATQVTEWCVDRGLTDRSALSLVDLPTFSSDELKQEPAFGEIDATSLSKAEFLRLSIEHTLRGYIRIADLTAGFFGEPGYPEFVPYTFYEVVALAAQQQSIWMTQGQAATLVFREHLDSLDLPYAKLWRRIEQVVSMLQTRVDPSRSQPQPHSIDQIAAIALWCLFGNYQAVGTAACPALRFINLATHLLKSSTLTDISRGVATRWDHWDLELDTQPWAEALEQMLGMNLRSATSYESLASRGEAPALLARAMRNYVGDQSIVYEQILSNPGNLADMSRYLSLPAGTLPFPIMCLDLDSFGYPQRKIEESPFIPITTVQSDDGKIATRLAMRHPSNGFLERLDDAIQFETFQQTCDLIFSDHAMPNDKLRAARQIAEATVGKKLLFLI